MSPRMPCDSLNYLFALIESLGSFHHAMSSSSSSVVEIFSELRGIFPFETLTNLKRAASFYKNDRASLESFVRNCVETHHFPELPHQTDSELENFLRTQFQTLKELLPDADPAFLEETFNMYGGTAGMEDFVMEAITHSYPKKIVPKREVTFDVKLYCDLVPDPVGSFSHKNYIMTDVMVSDAIDYLVKIFGEDKRVEISCVVKKEQSLYLSYRNMREMGKEENAQFCTTLKTVQPKTFDEAPDYGQVFEKLFIENEGVILSFLSRKREDDLKRDQTLRECSICSSLTLHSKFLKICGKGHEMCSNCVKEYTELLYHEAVLFFPCTFEGCKLLILSAVIRSVWDTSRYSKLLEDRIFNSNEDDQRVPCPFCNFLNQKSNSTEIGCVHCSKKFCVTCKKGAHLPLECNKKEDDMCKLVEESMTQALVRSCPKCHTPFIKERNCCNRVQCGKCKVYICYVCRKPLNDSTYNHFYGQGQMPSDAPGRCPLNSDINVLHVNSVIESGKKVLQKLKSDNPDIQLLYDPLAVLPKKEVSDAVPNQF